MGSRRPERGPDKVRPISLVLVKKQAVRQSGCVNISGCIDLETRRSRRKWPADADRVSSCRGETVKVERIHIGKSRTPRTQIRPNGGGPEYSRAARVLDRKCGSGFGARRHQ